LAKAFTHAEEYTEFKKQFAITGNVAKELESGTVASSTTQKEWKMNPEEIKQLLADTAKSAAEQATKSILAAQAEQEAKALAEAKAQEEFDARVKAAVAASVKTVDTGAERLLAEVTQRLEAQSAESKSALAGLEAAIKEKAAELAKIQSSKMQFGDQKNADEVSYADREKAVLLSKITGKSIADTKFGKDLMTKANNVGGHLPTTAGQSVWELEVSLNMENEVRRRLVVVPNIRAINMQTNVMTIPVNPEAGLATWVGNANFGAAASAGTTGTHQLKDITLNAYKLATNEYLNYEEEEDSLIVLLPIVRDAMVRRVARAMDRA